MRSLIIALVALSMLLCGCPPDEPATHCYSVPAKMGPDDRCCSEGGGPYRCSSDGHLEPEAEAVDVDEPGNE